MRGRGTGEGGRVMRASIAIAALFAFVFALPVPLPASPFPQDTSAGKTVYVKWCAGCHGDNGAGDGAGARRMIPPPRDFTAGLYQIRSTASGELPTDADLLRAIDAGVADAPLRPRAPRCARLHQDVLVVLRRYDAASHAARLRQRAGRRRRRRGAQGRAAILRFDRLPQMSR